MTTVTTETGFLDTVHLTPGLEGKMTGTSLRQVDSQCPTDSLHIYSTSEEQFSSMGVSQEAAKCKGAKTRT